MREMAIRGDQGHDAGGQSTFAGWIVLTAASAAICARKAAGGPEPSGERSTAPSPPAWPKGARGSEKAVEDQGRAVKRR